MTLFMFYSDLKAEILDKRMNFCRESEYAALLLWSPGSRPLKHFGNVWNVATAQLWHKPLKWENIWKDRRFDLEAKTTESVLGYGVDSFHAQSCIVSEG